MPRWLIQNTSGEAWAQGDLIEAHGSSGAVRRAQGGGDAGVLGWRPIGIVETSVSAGASGYVSGSGRATAALAPGQAAVAGQRAASAGSGQLCARTTEPWSVGTFAESKTAGGTAAAVLIDLTCLPL